MRSTFRRTHGIPHFHGCRSLSKDRLWGVLHEHKGGQHALAAFKTTRSARPHGAPIYIFCDNLSVNTTPAIRFCAAAHNVELCLTPTNASWVDPIEAQFGPLRTFPMANSDHPNNTTQARDPHTYLRWRDANNHRPHILAAQPPNTPTYTANDTNRGATDPKPKPPGEPGDPSGSTHQPQWALRGIGARMGTWNTPDWSAPDCRCRESAWA
jgi:hypothetical protein